MNYFASIMFLIVWVWSVFLIPNALAANMPPTPVDKPVTLTKTLEWSMQNDRGEQYRILISKPEGKVPWTGGYPVIYVLDANAYFASLHETKRAQKKFRQVIVVGIAYLGDAPHNFLRRSFDFSPPTEPEKNTPAQGGQDEFLDFLETKVMPAVNQRFQVNPKQQSLYGHSFGGMFAIYTLFNRPQLFNHIISASPSLWWNGKYLLPYEKQFRRNIEEGVIDVRHSSLTLIVAEHDALPSIQDTQQMYERLTNLSEYGLRSSFVIESGEDHMSIPFRIESRILRQISGSH